MSTKYSRILLKLSGEQLAGDFKSGIDPSVATWLAKEIKKAVETGCQVVIIAGGGNMVRGEEVAGQGIKRVTADQMGMLSGLINAIALTDIFEAQGLKTRCLSNIFAQQVAESYSFRLAEKHLQKGRVVIVAGGIARPYFTHDVPAVNIGLELDCDVVLKASKVDGVYDDDPAKNPAAVRYESLTLQEAIENPNVRVMDKAALGLAMEHDMKLVVFDAFKEGNLLALVNGDQVGTTIS